MPSLSPAQRLALIRLVNGLPQPEFETLVFALDPTQGVIPSNVAAQGDRASALLQWVKGPTGCGMEAFLQVLSQIAPLPAELRAVLPDLNEDRKPLTLPEQMNQWFNVLGYGREGETVVGTENFEGIITIPVRRKRYDRIFVKGVTKEAGLADLQALKESVEHYGTDEG